MCSALIGDLTLTVPAEAEQATAAVPAPPATCSASEPDPGTLTVDERVWVVLPSVRLQVTVTSPLLPVTVTAGLANTRYDEPAGRASEFTAAGVVPTEAVF